MRSLTGLAPGSTVLPGAEERVAEERVAEERPGWSF